MHLTQFARFPFKMMDQVKTQNSRKNKCPQSWHEMVEVNVKCYLAQKFFLLFSFLYDCGGTFTVLSGRRKVQRSNKIKVFVV